MLGAENPRGNLCGREADCDGHSCAICQFISQGKVLAESAEPPPQALERADVAAASADSRAARAALGLSISGPAVFGDAN